jgi:alkanesulfonate monooxygenase SsuD/methylene tetrahydromethanopterin reductase-like flavin-dependent oxidoreductase (luciferase family)
MTAPSHNWAGLWSHPRDTSINYNSLDYWVDYAKIAERGLLDGIFLADVFGVYDVFGDSADTAIRHAVQLPNAEPTLLVSAMAMATKHLGFGITSNLTFEHPYQLARRFSTLDHLTNGRIGWNIVTGYLDSGARGMGLPASPVHDERYDAAEDFLEARTNYGKAAGRTMRSAAIATRASLPIRQRSIRSGTGEAIIVSTASTSPNRRRSGRRCCIRREPRSAAAPLPPGMRKRSFSTARPSRSWRVPRVRSGPRQRNSAAIPTISGCLPEQP